jgi:hypothetical protein
MPKTASSDRFETNLMTLACLAQWAAQIAQPYSGIFSLSFAPFKGLHFGLVPTLVAPFLTDWPNHAFDDNLALLQITLAQRPMLLPMEISACPFSHQISQTPAQYRGREEEWPSKMPRHVLSSAGRHNPISN